MSLEEIRAEERAWVESAYRAASTEDEYVTQLETLVVKLSTLLPGPRGREIGFTHRQAAIINYLKEVLEDA